MIDRLAAAGFSALVLTVDAPVPGWSPRAARAQHAPSPEIRNINMPGQPMARTAYHPDFAGKVMYPATWRELEWLAKRAPMPVMVKGVLRADDAARCAACGARAVIVSNHGGRHLDSTVTTAAVIAEIAQALSGKAEVYVDGGIRRGTDILKALALGARAVLIGRPVIWGLDREWRGRRARRARPPARRTHARHAALRGRQSRAIDARSGGVRFPSGI